MSERVGKREPADFRRGARDVREGGESRDAPERRDGALPADQESPEFSRGEPLDDPQPSARRREDLESEADRSTDADVRSDERDI
jgi:hypothetical protein